MTAIIYLIFFVLSFILMFNGTFWGGFILMIVSSAIYLYCYSMEQNEIEMANNKRIQSMSKEDRQKYYDDNTIDYTIVAGEDSRKSVGSSVVRGAIGAAVLGPVGLVGGALSGKNKTKTTFTIVYKSGRREVITVDNDSNQFKEYASYLI